MQSVEAAPGRRVVGRILKSLLDRAKDVRKHVALLLDQGKVRVVRRDNKVFYEAMRRKTAPA